MKRSDRQLLGVGLYGVAEAGRLTNMPSRRVRRWLAGYTYTSRGRSRRSPPVWRRQLEDRGADMTLGFLDLMEIRFVNAFRTRGVSWKTIRTASLRASEVLRTTHPFCTHEFLTNGREIFLELMLSDEERGLLELSKGQHVFREFLLPYLHNVDIVDQVPRRWWPMGKDHRVVLDPARRLGKPIVSKEGVRTLVLSEAFAVEKSFDTVAAWYEVEPASVREAVRYEESISA